MGELIGDVSPQLVFADAANQTKLTERGIANIALSHVNALRTGAVVRCAVDPEPDAPVVIIATSGSTARPKGVVYSSRSMTAAAAEFALHAPMCFGPGTRTLTFPSLSTSAGLVQLVTYLVMGCSLYIEAAFEAESCLDMVVNEKINVLGGAPIFFERMAASPRFAQADVSSLRLATVGGAPVSRPLLEAWHRRGVVIRQMYGQTEVGGYATLMSEHEALLYPEKCGRGGMFNDMRVVDADGKDCPAGVPGEILLRGPGVMLGYWNNPTATAETLRDGWLHTGDIGMLDETGLLTFVDRKKDIIISGGLNISAAEVERAILAFEGVQETVVIGAPDPRFGETPLAIVYASCEISVQQLVAHCNDRLADFKVPRYVVLSPEPLPRLATGKLSKVMLRRQYAEAHLTLERVR